MGLSRNCPELAFVSSRAPCPAAGCLEQCVWEGTWVYSLSSQWGAASVFYCGCCYHELKWLNTTWMILSLFLSPDGCCWAKVKAPTGRLPSSLEAPGRGWGWADPIPALSSCWKPSAACPVAPPSAFTPAAWLPSDPALIIGTCLSTTLQLMLPPLSCIFKDTCDDIFNDLDDPGSPACLRPLISTLNFICNLKSLWHLR